MEKELLSHISAGTPGVMLVIGAADLKKAVEHICDARDKKIEAEYARKQAEKSKDFTLTRNDVAKMLGVSKETLCRWHQSGYLRGRKIGVAIRYCPADVDRILQLGKK